MALLISGLKFLMYLNLPWRTALNQSCSSKRSEEAKINSDFYPLDALQIKAFPCMTAGVLFRQEKVQLEHNQ